MKVKRKNQLQKLYSKYTDDALKFEKAELESKIYKESLDVVKELYRKQAYFIRDEMKQRGIV